MKKINIVLAREILSSYESVSYNTIKKCYIVHIFGDETNKEWFRSLYRTQYLDGFESYICMENWAKVLNYSYNEAILNYKNKNELIKVLCEYKLKGFSYDIYYYDKDITTESKRNVFDQLSLKNLTGIFPLKIIHTSEGHERVVYKSINELNSEYNNSIIEESD